MSICPITYEDTEGRYSPAGLARLARGLTELEDFPWTAIEQLQKAAEQADKISIQGVQPKLSVRFSVTQKSFYLVENRGQYILKPPNLIYPELPENEDLTMRLAKTAGIEVPFHGMVYSKGGALTYFIKRFDRLGPSRRLAMEDFAQLSGLDRKTKYRSSLEKVAKIIEQFCTFPKIENVKLYRWVLFAFLVGNEDMHLKNFSLITREGKVYLSPAYDMVNTTITLANPIEESALTLNGRKNKLRRKDFFEYYGRERLGLLPKILDHAERDFHEARPTWDQLLQRSFLSDEMKGAYRALVEERWERLFG